MKTCPTCEKEYEDEETKCPDDGSTLVKSGVENNPQLPKVRSAAPDARTAMFTLEEFQKEKERIDQAAENPFGDGDSGAETASTISPLAALPDKDATRAITPEQLENMRKERDAQRNGAVVAPALAEGTIPKEASAPKTQATAVKKRGVKPVKNADEEKERKKMILIVLAGSLGLIALVGISSMLTFRKVALEIVTVPPGALVLVDGVEHGNSPLTVSVGKGAHSVRARLAGYQEAADVVDVTGTRAFVLSLKKEADSAAPVPAAIQEKADSLYKEAQTSMKEGKIDDAEAKLRALAALLPNDARAQDGLSDIQKRKSQPKASPRPGGDDDKGSSKKEDDDPEVGKLSKAQRSKAAQKSLDLARTAYDSGEMGKAKELLSKCVRYDPNKVQCHRILARVYTKEDNNEKVKYHLQRYLELGGSDDDFKVRDWLRSH